MAEVGRVRPGATGDHEPDAGGAPRRVEPSRRLGMVIGLAVLAVGVSDIMTQLTLMRELLNVFAGNELVFGVILGNWLILSAAGAYLGRWSRRCGKPLHLLIAVQILVAVTPVVSVYALRVLRNVVFVRGAALGLTEAVVSSFVLLGPYCLVAGFRLTLASTLLPARRGADGIAGVYFLDSVGGILGGLLFSFVLVYLLGLGHLSILYVPAAANLALAVMLAGVARLRITAAAAAAIGVGLAALVTSTDLEDASLRRQYAGRHIVYHGNSPYGDLLVTESAGQYNFISSGLTLFSASREGARDVEQAEETVHYAMVQRPAAPNVLLIGGGVSGTVAEILKYPVRRVDYVELDPLILKVADKYLPGVLADPRVHVATTDGRLFVKQTDRRYDVVIVDMPEPSTLQVNRLYTVEFFGEVKRILRREKPQGVLCFSLGTYENYVSPELASLIATTHKTLREVFGRVLILPPGRVFFLASDGDLYDDIAGRIEEHAIPTRLVRRSYLYATLTPFRMEAMRQALRGDAEVNRDFSPVLYFRQLRRWMSQFDVRFGLLGGLLAVVLVLFLLQVRAVSFAVFTTGFAASALEVVLLLSFQILHGFVYHKLGVLITVFMLGLAAGSLIMSRLLRRWSGRGLIALEAGIAAYAAALPLALMGLGRLGGAWAAVSAEGVLPLLTLVLAVLVGMEFPLAARVDFLGVAPTAARLYLADLVGACLGAMLVSTLLIPLISVGGVCWLVAALNVVSGGVLLLRRRR